MGDTLTSIKEVSVNLKGIQLPNILTLYWHSIGNFQFMYFHSSLPLCPSIQEDLCVFILSVLIPLGLAWATSGLSALLQGESLKRKKS